MKYYETNSFLYEIIRCFLPRNCFIDSHRIKYCIYLCKSHLLRNSRTNFVECTNALETHADVTNDSYIVFQCSQYIFHFEFQLWNVWYSITNVCFDWENVFFLLNLWNIFYETVKMHKKQRMISLYKTNIFSMKESSRNSIDIS